MTILKRTIKVHTRKLKSYVKHMGGDWFARDREKDECWSGDIDNVSCLPAELVEHLKAYKETK